MVVSKIGGFDSREFFVFVICLPSVVLLTCLLFVSLLRVHYSLQIMVNHKEIRVEERIFGKRRVFNFKFGEAFRRRIVVGGGLQHIASSSNVEFGHYLGKLQQLEVAKILNGEEEQYQ
jgi:hypothetical protein